MNWDADGGERTEPATPRRRAEARRLGQVPRSADFTAAVALLGAAGGLLLAGPRLAAACRAALERFLSGPAVLRADQQIAMAWLHDAGALALAACLGVLALAVCGALVGEIVQFGLVFAPSQAAPQARRAAALPGLQRVLVGAPAAAWSAGLKPLVVALVATWGLAAHWPQIVALPRADVGQFAPFLVERWLVLSAQIVVALLLLGVGDLARARWRHERSLRMTAQELREERRLSEGDPGARRHAARHAA